MKNLTKTQSLLRKMAIRLVGTTTSAHRQLQTAARRRTLAVESLEGRALMAITPLSIAYKPLDFTGSVAISGAISGSIGNYPTTGSFSGQLGLSGNLNYSGTTAGVGTATVNGTVSGSIFGYSKKSNHTECEWLHARRRAGGVQLANHGHLAAGE